MKIGNLPDGTYFKFNSVNQKLWRGCFVYKCSYSSVLVNGFHRDSESDGWKPIPKGYYVSCGTDVEPCSREEAGGGAENIISEGGVLVKKRGRHSNFKLELPKGEFTIQDLAKKYDKPVSFVYNHFKKIVDTCQKVGVRKKDGVRGKGETIYKLAED